VEGLVKIHNNNNNNNNLSKRTRCLETLPPILILHLRQEAPHLVCPFHLALASLLLVLKQGPLGAVTTIRRCLVPQSPAQGVSAHLEEEGRQPLTRVAERLLRQTHPSRPRQIQACLDSRMRLGARLGLAPLQTNRQQAPSDQRPVCPLVNFLV